MDTLVEGDKGIKTAIFTADAKDQWEHEVLEELEEEELLQANWEWIGELVGVGR